MAKKQKKIKLNLKGLAPTAPVSGMKKPNFGNFGKSAAKPSAFKF